MENIKLISIKHRKGKVVAVHNPTNYKLIGRGKQGAVFKLSKDHCMKMFASQKHFNQERNAYMRAKDSSLLPKLYEIGSNYIIMEYIKGTTLEDYLQKEQHISKSLTRKILSMINEMKRLEFTRYNVRMKHVIITPNNELKIIDHTNSYRIKEKRPLLLFEHLKKLGLLKAFLKHVKELDKKTYLKWKQSMSNYLK